MRLHASCVARGDAGVLLIGPPGSGKSDLVLRLAELGFMLVADDQVLVEAGEARAPDRVAGLLEIRGLGLLRRPYRARARLAMVTELVEQPVERLPAPVVHAGFGLPLFRLFPRPASAALLVSLALDCLQGRAAMVVGAFVP